MWYSVNSPHKKTRPAKGRDVESRGTTLIAPRTIGGPLEGCNGADRPTLAEARGNYQARRARERIVCALRRHILYSSLSGRMLQGEFTVSATPGFHHSPFSIVREPLLLPFIASEYAQCPVIGQYSMGDSRVSMTIVWLDEHLFLR